jgi:hypothetical protein
MAVKRIRLHSGCDRFWRIEHTNVVRDKQLIQLYSNPKWPHVRMTGNAADLNGLIFSPF